MLHKYMRVHKYKTRITKYCMYFMYNVVQNVIQNSLYTADNLGRSQWPRGLRRRSSAARPLRTWVRIPVVSDVCCRVEVSATDCSLVQRSPTDCGVAL